ncbi:MAG: hypothetical protein HY060_07220 [Proteobacteria bacterium]|nr:hypothetical protein [Pseudomonadota bacterium]
MTCRVKIFVQRPSDTLAVAIGTKEVSLPIVEGQCVTFEHRGARTGGTVRSVDPADWEPRGVVPAIVVKLIPRL